MDKLTLHIEYQIVPKEFWSNLSPTHFVHDTRHQYEISTQKGVKHREALREKRLSITCAILSIAYILCWIPFSLTQDSLETSDAQNGTVS